MVTHRTTDVVREKSPPKSFCSLVAGIDNSRDVVHLNLSSRPPLLNCKELNVNVTGTRSRLPLIDHVNAGFVVDIERSRFGLFKAQLTEDRTEVLCNLGSTDTQNKFSLCIGGSNGSLQLGLESDGATGKGKDVSSDRAVCVGIRAISSIKVANQSKEVMFRKGWKRRIDCNRRRSHLGERFDRFLSPVDNAPVNSAL